MNSSSESLPGFYKDLCNINSGLHFMQLCEGLIQQKRFINPNINSHRDKEKVKTMGIIIYESLVDSLFSRLAASNCFVVQSHHHILDDATVADFKWVMESKK